MIKHPAFPGTVGPILGSVKYHENWGKFGRAGRVVAGCPQGTHLSPGRLQVCSLIAPSFCVGSLAGR